MSDKLVSMQLSWLASACDPSVSSIVIAHDCYGLFGWAGSCNLLACPLQV